MLTIIILIINVYLAVWVSIVFELNKISVALLFSIVGLCVFWSVCDLKETPKVSASYEITVNEKSFKTSDFKTKEDGSIEFTAEDGTIIHASTYEIRKLNQETEKTEEMKK